ncbi:hypothetical protein NQ317_005171 [Molorchus minor]|uniref:Uncharacterized protein n=1 Tax=Molorchus minor TaxID=1323400 RepID=A0ABQ9JDV4_9CUCU|nr:hypothetical protein NQ317_005171 [Molorchus minor]
MLKLQLYLKLKVDTAYGSVQFPSSARRCGGCADILWRRQVTDKEVLLTVQMTQVEFDQPPDSDRSIRHEIEDGEIHVSVRDREVDTAYGSVQFLALRGDVVAMFNFLALRGDVTDYSQKLMASLQAVSIPLYQISNSIGSTASTVYLTDINGRDKKVRYAKA